MAKLFCVSDIHGFYDEFRQALDDAGFDANNEEHFCIVLGDCFDRGKQPVEVMRYLQGLPRKILVKGNHESLLQDLCDAGYPSFNDVSNGTYDTVCAFGGAGLGRSFEECCIITEHRTKNFIYSMVNYFETKNYIFVHSFVPLKNLDGKPMYYTKNRKFAIDPDWRHAHASAWEEARCGNPYELAKQGFLPDKTLVFGHWSTYDQRARDYEGEDLFDPIYGDGYIGIDATTALSGKVNVLVLEDEFMEDNSNGSIK
jgi:serine/threonine protein phosphatase 1